MNKYGVIFKKSFMRTRSMMVDADSIESMDVSLDPREAFVEHVVDFDNREIISVVLKADGRLMRIEDGDFGESTTADYFEDGEVSTMPAPEPEVSTMEED
jgi:hypothetical protein